MLIELFSKHQKKLFTKQNPYIILNVAFESQQLHPQIAPLSQDSSPSWVPTLIGKSKVHVTPRALKGKEYKYLKLIGPNIFLTLLGLAIEKDLNIRKGKEESHK